MTCPLGLKLSTLYMGAPGSAWGPASGLQAVARAHGAAMSVRWWDATDRLNNKSLVVFELSNVLCPYDVLDEVLQQAGVEPSSVTAAGGPWQQHASKVALLRGRSAKAEEEVVRRLELSQGARLVCGALKAMGLSLAILTQTGVRGVSERLQHELGIDYVICQHLETVDGCFTGKYDGEESDVRFRKSDLLRLMAAREGVDLRNVVLVGEFLGGLRASDARLMLETFGPNVHVSSGRAPDLAQALYLLGFSGSHVRALRERYEPRSAGPAEAPPAAAPPCEPSSSSATAGPGPAPGTRATAEALSTLLEVSAHTRAPGQLASIFAPLARAAGVHGAAVQPEGRRHVFGPRAEGRGPGGGGGPQGAPPELPHQGLPGGPERPGRGAAAP